MDWVHCNKCFIQPGDVEGRKFSITNCGHIYCGECLQLPELKECHICHNKYNTISLTPKMSPEVEVYFHDPIQNIQKQIKVLEFQQGHRIRLVTCNRERLSQYKQLKNEMQLMKQELNRLKEENRALQEEAKRRKEEAYHYKKKCELMARQGSAGSSAVRRPQPSPSSSIIGSFTPREQLRSTPVTRMSSIKSIYSQGHDTSSEGSQNSILKRPPCASEFFMMSGSKSSIDNESLFGTPKPPSFPGSYRNVQNHTPLSDFNSPATPDSSQRISSQKDPLQRKMKLPGDRGGPSPATKIGFNRLNLSRPTSTSQKEVPMISKYSKYY